MASFLPECDLALTSLLGLLQFKVSTLDVSIPEEAEQIVKLAESLAPLGGIFHLAMVLTDKLIPNQVNPLIILIPQSMPH